MRTILSRALAELNAHQSVVLVTIGAETSGLEIPVEELVSRRKPGQAVLAWPAAGM